MLNYISYNCLCIVSGIVKGRCRGISHTFISFQASPYFLFSRRVQGHTELYQPPLNALKNRFKEIVKYAIFTCCFKFLRILRLKTIILTPSCPQLEGPPKPTEKYHNSLCLKSVLI